jgi:oxaloacetate decarboxylase alpha subunit
VRLLATVAGVTQTIEVDDANGADLVRVKVDQREYLVDVTNPAPGLYSLLVEGKVFSAFVWQRRGKREVQVGGVSASVEVDPAQGRRPAARSTAVVSGRQEITAPMSGRVVHVLVHKGQTVQDGESLVIIEAMKMETEIRAVAHGKVEDIQVEAGMAVETGQLLLVVEGSEKQD